MSSGYLYNNMSLEEFYTALPDDLSTSNNTYYNNASTDVKGFLEKAYNQIYKTFSIPEIGPSGDGVKYISPKRFLASGVIDTVPGWGDGVSDNLSSGAGAYSNEAKAFLVNNKLLNFSIKSLTHAIFPKFTSDNNRKFEPIYEVPSVLKNSIELTVSISMIAKASKTAPAKYQLQCIEHFDTTNQTIAKIESSNPLFILDIQAPGGAGSVGANKYNAGHGGGGGAFCRLLLYFPTTEAVYNKSFPFKIKCVPDDLNNTTTAGICIMNSSGTNEYLKVPFGRPATASEKGTGGKFTFVGGENITAIIGTSIHSYSVEGYSAGIYVLDMVDGASGGTGGSNNPYKDGTAGKGIGTGGGYVAYYGSHLLNGGLNKINNVIYSYQVAGGEVNTFGGGGGAGAFNGIHYSLYNNDSGRAILYPGKSDSSTFAGFGGAGGNVSGGSAKAGEAGRIGVTYIPYP